MGMIQWIHVSHLKRFWWELHRKHDLIRNFNIFQVIFLSKNTEKTPRNTISTYQLKITHMIYGMIPAYESMKQILSNFHMQCLSMYKHRKTHKNTENDKIYQLEITKMIWCMIQHIHAENLNWFWWALGEEHALFRNLNIFQGHIFLSKNSD